MDLSLVDPDEVLEFPSQVPELLGDFQSRTMGEKVTLNGQPISPCDVRSADQPAGRQDQHYIMQQDLGQPMHTGVRQVRPRKALPAHGMRPGQAG